jgi:hypothetical protein
MKNKAYEHEQKVQRTMFYKRKIKELIEKVKLDPLGSDYSDELEKLHKENPKDKGIILLAERQAYAEEKK